MPALSTATDSAGRIYIAGTVSGQVTGAYEGALQPAYTPGECIAFGFHTVYKYPCQDVFVMRLDPSGTEVEAATYIGGASMEQLAGLQIAADGSVDLTIFSSSKRIDSLALNTEETELGAIVLKLDPDLKRALRAFRLPSNLEQAGLVLTDGSFVFSALKCPDTGCTASFGVYNASGTKTWEKSIFLGQSYTLAAAAAPGRGWLWIATVSYVNGTFVPVVARLRLSDGVELMRVPLAGLGYSIGLTAMPDGSVVASALPVSGGFSLTIINPDGTQGATRLFQGTLRNLLVDHKGVVHAIGQAGLKLPTPSQSLRRCPASANDSFALGWRPADGSISYATFLDGGVTSMALSGEQVVVARTNYSAAVSTELQFLNPAEFPEQPPCLSAQVANFGGPVTFNSEASKQVAPGEFLWIYGSGLGPAEEVRIEMDGTRSEAPRELAGTRVLFDGQPAAILVATETRVLVQAPYAIAGRQQTVVRVERDGSATNAVSLTVKEALPSTIPGFRGAIYNADGSLNSETNGAQPGEVVTIFVSGGGKLEGIIDDAAAVQAPPPALATPVTAVIAGSGGQAVTFAGGVVGQLPGLVQVNVRIGYDFAFHGRLQLELWFGPVGTGAMALVELFVR